MGERSPPEGYFFLQRLLEPPICVVAPYLHTFLNSAGCQVKLFQYQNLSKSIQKNARADLAPPPVCQFAASSLSVQDTAFFQIGFLPIFVFCISQAHFMNCPALRCEPAEHVFSVWVAGIGHQFYKSMRSSRLYLPSPHSLYRVHDAAQHYNSNR